MMDTAEKKKEKEKKMLMLLNLHLGGCNSIGPSSLWDMTKCTVLNIIFVEHAII